MFPGFTRSAVTDSSLPADVYCVSNLLRRAATAVLSATTGLTALAVAVTGLAQPSPGTGSAPTLETLRAQTAQIEDVAAHGTTDEGYVGDVAPEGVDVHQQVSTADLVERADTVADPGAPSGASGRVSTGCSGDGTTGNRVQVVYVRASDRPDRYDAVVGSLRAYTAGVDAVFLASALQSGGRRQVRWVHDASCQPVVARAVVSPAEIASFGAQQAALKAQGYNRGDRKYLLFTDAAVMCGVANVYTDTSPLQDNANNGGWAQYARVDAPCWGSADHSVEAHELTHTLGAVLSFAPHVSPAGHCTDESDLMCYSDAPGVVMTQSCPTTQEKLLDCGGDDYFNLNPPAGSALAQNWNAANSSFLYDPPGPTLTASGYDPASGLVAVVPGVPSGQGWRIDWAGAGCSFGAASTDSSQPGAATNTVSCPAGGSATATLVQQDGRSASAAVGVAASGQPAPVRAAPAPAQASQPTADAVTSQPATSTPVPQVAATLRGTRTVSAGKPVRLTAAVTSGGAGVPRARVTLQRRSGTSWRWVGTSWTNSAGATGFSQVLRSSAAYRVVATTGRTVAHSGEMTVSVVKTVRAKVSGKKVVGKVSPARKGTLVTLVKGGRKVSSVRTDSKGQFTLQRPRSRGRFTVLVAGFKAPVR